MIRWKGEEEDSGKAIVGVNEQRSKSYPQLQDFLNYKNIGWLCRGESGTIRIGARFSDRAHISVDAHDTF